MNTHMYVYMYVYSFLKANLLFLEAHGMLRVVMYASPSPVPTPTDSILLNVSVYHNMSIGNQSL